MATMVYRLEIPGFKPARCDSQAATIAFWKFAAPTAAGKGLNAKLWFGERDASGREVWTFAPQLIGIDEVERARAVGPGPSKPSPRAGG